MTVPLKAIRERAIQTHVHRVNMRNLATEDLPFGPITEMGQWCTDNIGPRWLGWCYLGGGVWAFDDEENVAWFLLRWR